MLRSSLVCFRMLSSLSVVCLILVVVDLIMYALYVMYINIVVLKNYFPYGKELKREMCQILKIYVIIIRYVSKIRYMGHLSLICDIRWFEALYPRPFV